MISRRSLLRHVATTVAASAAGACIMQVPSKAAPADPLLDLINRYNAAVERYDSDDLAEDEWDDAGDRVSELSQNLKDWTGPATTTAGAIAALRLARDLLQHSYDGYERAMIAAVLGYLEGRAGA